MKLSAHGSLAIVVGVFFAVGLYRSLHFYLTGFFVPD